MKDTWFIDPLPVIENLLFAVVLLCEVLRAYMAHRLNKAGYTPKFRQVLGYSILMPSVIDPYRRTFPGSFEPGLLKWLRITETLLFLVVLATIFTQSGRNLY